MPFKHIAPPTTSFINAVAEITQAANAVIPMTFVEDWLEKYRWHYEQFSLPPLSGYEDENICTFHSLYYYFSEIAAYYRLSPTCSQAVQEYQAVVAATASIHGNETLTEWLRRYEKIGTQDLILFPSHDDSVNIVRTIDDTAYVVSRSEFSSIDEFRPIFEHLFYEEKLLPESIEEILRYGEQITVSEGGFNKQILNDYPHVICDECKLLGACKKYSRSGLVDEKHLDSHCPYDDIKNSMRS